MIFELLILGSTSAVPTFERYLSCQILNVHDKLYMIDCGEGTQFRLQHFRISHHKIENIFISHLHGDHILGLPGLINSMNINARKKKLRLFCPVGLDKMLETIFEISGSKIGFEIEYCFIDFSAKKKIYEDSEVEIFSFPLDHRIGTAGFRFNEKGRLRNIDPSTIARYGLSYNQIRAAKYGNDIEFADGNVIRNKDITLPPKKLRSFAYCSDTKYNPGIISSIKNVDLLYHESTYLEHLSDKANERFHSTAMDAAKIAKKAGAGKLLLGHFSSRYSDLSQFVTEAKEYFDDVELGIEGKRFTVDLKNIDDEF
ncbi:MAG: ribonuclease Z [Deltaproteobacteria bacterium]